MFLLYGTFAYPAYYTVQHVKGTMFQPSPNLLSWQNIGAWFRV